MQYFKDLPGITSTGDDDENQIELEVSGRVERLPDDENTEIVFVGRMGKTIYLIAGTVVKYEYIEPKKAFANRDFTRLTFDGSCVTVF